MYAVINDGGKQYKVSVGDLIQLEKKEIAPGTIVEFPKVLYYNKNKETLIGNPYLEGIKVKGIVQKTSKGEKLVIYKYRRRKDSHVKKGHRQIYTYVRINEIGKV